MQRIASVLSTNGYEVELVGRQRKHSIPLDLMPFKQKRLNCIFDKGKLFYLEYNLRLFWYLIFTKAAVYGAIDLDTILPCSIVAKFKQSKLVFDAHEYFTEVPELTGRKFSRYIWQAVANICIPLVDKAYTVAPQLAILFSKQYGIKFETILNVPPYNPPINENINLQNLPVIFYQGALNEGRGLPELIRAMTQINGTLRIVGEGDLSELLRLLVKDLKLQNKVQFLGFIKPIDLSLFTSEATIACNLLEPKGLSYQYSLANKFFDYMHAGIPQLCADFIEYRQINEQFEVAVLCNCHTEEIANKINNLLVNKKLYNLLKHNCAKAARVYNLQQEEKKIIQIYQSLFS
nr:glycosyltransferase [Pseudopedobacter sp.]